MSTMTLDGLLATLEARDLIAEAAFVRAHLAQPAQAVDEFPPLPPCLVQHPQIGPMFDRMQMHSYALKMADNAVSAQAVDVVTLVDRDVARVALWRAISNIKIGNKTDDKLILRELGELGYWIARLPDDEPQTRALSGEKAGPVDGWTKRQIAVTRYALWRFAQEARSHASSAAQQREDGDAAIASSFLDDAAVAEQVRTLLPASPAPDKEG